jgi:hypothetical protein
VGGITAVLGRRRVVALAVLVAALAVYFAAHVSLPGLSLWPDIALLGFVVMPAVLAVVWLLLPFWSASWLPWGGGVCAVLVVAFELLHWEAPASFAKLGAATFLAWWFLTLFEDVSWVALVAVIIPWVDAYSVFQGPTKAIVTKKPGIFDALSFAFPWPGQHSTANLGVPDLVFFALFLAATMRWALRPGLTWVLMTASFGVTIALAVWLNIGGLHGLPALPLLSAAFLVANGDLLWKALRHRPKGQASQT